jgi:hypothetical protein
MRTNWSCALALFFLAACDNGSTATDAPTSDTGGSDMLLAQCLDICGRAETAMCRCGGMTAPPPETSCPTTAAAVRTGGCESQYLALMSCLGSAPDLCLAFMGSSGPCGDQQGALSTCMSP